jgi:eukaryotic-like serine/threonine-protein kinase
MARVDADRNLLLGILAQQMDFVTRDALFEAMNAWIIHKETSLGTLLVERGDPAKSRQVLLEALVDEHIRAHDGDPARSLEALSSVGSVAEDLGRIPDTDVQASVGHLSIRGAVPPSADAPETRIPTSLGEPTSWNGRFRVVRPHASGGLGVVSVALDDELDREVAFKEIKDRYADDGGRRARFVLEAIR